MDLFFAPSAEDAVKPATGRQSAAEGVAVGGKQLVRAAASGAVDVEQPGRHGTASHADYTAAEGKFVLSGGSPTIYDATGNKTNGRQLTFFFGDDSIGVDSAEGLRSVTLHRVGK